MHNPERKVAVGVYSSSFEARRAIDELHQAGFTDDEIGFISREEKHHAAGDEVETSKMTEGAVAGLATGAGVGGLWALGIAAGMLPAIGPAIAGGILGSLITSAAAGAAAVGLVGALIGLGIPEDEAKHYDEQFRSGKTIITVYAGERYALAHSILSRLYGESRGAQADNRHTGEMSGADLMGDISNRDEQHSEITEVAGTMYSSHRNVNEEPMHPEAVTPRLLPVERHNFPKHNPMLAKADSPAEDTTDSNAENSGFARDTANVDTLRHSSADDRPSEYTSIDVPVHRDVLGTEPSSRSDDSPNDITHAEKSVRVPLREEQVTNASQPRSDRHGSDVKRFEDQQDMGQPKNS
jgi:hypothetical protein